MMPSGETLVSRRLRKIRSVDEPAALVRIATSRRRGVSETIETNTSVSLAPESVVPRHRLALLVVLVAAAVASVLVPWLLTAPAPTAAMAPNAVVTTTAGSGGSSASGPSTAGTSTIIPPNTPAQAQFAPIAVEAEYAANIISPGATVEACGPCSGRFRVHGLTGPVGLIVPLDVPAAGTRTVTVLYEAEGVRHLVVAVNDAVVFDRDVIGPDANTPETVSFVTFIPAGAVRVAFDTAENVSGPDIDKVTIS